MSFIFLIAGRTGGPFAPLPSFAVNLPELESVYFDVKNGFATQALHSGEILEFLPDVRFTGGFLTKVLAAFRLVKSIVVCLVFVFKYKPSMVVSTGSFLAVPMVFAVQITNKLGLTHTAIVVHQQDPELGLTHKIIAKYAGIRSCVFKYTKSKYSIFSDAYIISNPINTEKFKLADFNSIKNNFKLYNFLTLQSHKPLLLIFGGGSGAEFINMWVEKSRDQLLEQFRIIHLTGVLQTRSISTIHHIDYFQTDILTTEMPCAMKLADLVLCRPGLGSISELLFLSKPAFLVPIPDSHQEKNAIVVSDSFVILNQKKVDAWSDIIVASFPKEFINKKYPDTVAESRKTQIYFDQIRNLLQH